MKKSTTTQPAPETIEKQPHDFLAEVKIQLIQVSSTNDMFRDQADLEEAGLKELIDSIREKGILQPVLLRSHGNGSFILVAGERRLRACTALGMDTIPAYVKEMTESEAFELQLTENLQRQDVHPMKEAKAYRALLDQRNWTTAELALRFGKSETYVLQRLRLTTLLPEIAKDFVAGDLNLAQALVIARLEKADQEQLLEECKNSNGRLNNKRNYYESAQELENYILENVTRELKAVPWDLDDAQLVPKAGACSACAKRSGAQGKLFADIKEKDRCFDSACFKGKLGASLFITVKKLVEEKPDTIFVTEGDYYGVEKPDQRIMSYLAHQKIKPMEYGRGYSSNDYGQYKKAVKAFYINGSHAGHFKQVYVAGPATKAVKSSSVSGEQKVTAADIKESIERIKQRTKRAAELDVEKVYEKVIAQGVKSEHMKIGFAPGTKEDWALVTALLWEFVGYNQDELKGIKIPEAKYGQGIEGVKKEADALAAVPIESIPQLARQVAIKCREHYGLPQKASTAMGVLITRAAKSWGIPVDQYEKEQAEERTRREERAANRIKELQAQLKPGKESKKGGGKK